MTDEPDVLVQEGRPPPSRRRVALAVVLVLAALALVRADAWQRSREADALLRAAAAGRSTVLYAEGRVQSVLEYAQSALLSPQVRPGVRSSLQDLVRSAAGDRVPDLVRRRAEAAGVRVLPWHGAQARARASWLAYLDARIAYEREVAGSFAALYAPHPQLATLLAAARSAYARMGAGTDAGRVQEVFGPPR